MLLECPCLQNSSTDCKSGHKRMFDGEVRGIATPIKNE